MDKMVEALEGCFGSRRRRGIDDIASVTCTNDAAYRRASECSEARTDAARFLRVEATSVINQHRIIRKVEC